MDKLMCIFVYNIETHTFNCNATILMVTLFIHLQIQFLKKFHISVLLQ